jgi:hypothetical protein
MATFEMNSTGQMVEVWLAHGADTCTRSYAALVAAAAAAGHVEMVYILLQAVQRVLSAQHNVPTSAINFKLGKITQPATFPTTYDGASTDLLSLTNVADIGSRSCV